MKIKKITESIQLQEAEDMETFEDDINIKDVSEGAAEMGKEVTSEQAATMAKEAKDVVQKFNLHPYEATATLSDVEQKLQSCLEAAVADKENGIDADYPDMLIYGLAGFGKTAGVKAFCRDHGIHMLALDAKTLRPEQLSGLPKAVTDVDGNEVQGNLALPLWTELDDHEAVILVVDEVNRAKPNVIGTLLGLICDHELPIYHRDEHGNYQATKHFNNILFTVALINPASRDLFQDVNELDPAFVNRFAVQHEARADAAEFLNIITKIYNAILKINLPQAAIDRYEGQLNIAQGLLQSQNFEFDDRERAVQAHKAQRTEGRPRDTLSYRSFLKLLRLCDGTVADFTKKIKWHGFLNSTVQMLENCIKEAHIVDKKSKSNSIFGKAEATPEQKANAQSIENNMDEFTKNLAE